MVLDHLSFTQHPDSISSNYFRSMMSCVDERSRSTRIKFRWIQFDSTILNIILQDRAHPLPLLLVEMHQGALQHEHVWIHDKRTRQMDLGSVSESKAMRPFVG